MGKVVIAVGGTGGHVFPALSLGRQLREKGLEVVFIGGGLSQNKYFDHKSHTYHEVTCGFVSTLNPIRFITGVAKSLYGAFESRKLFKRYKTAIVIGFGSYYTVPALLAAKWSAIPFILHEKDAFPGRVNRLFSRFAFFTAISNPHTAKHLSGKTCEVDMSLMHRFSETPVTKEEARKHYKLHPHLKTILVFGGSQGAHSINQCFIDSISHLKDIQILHFTGNPEVTHRASQIYFQKKIPACVKDFENRMDMAWRASDLALTRAGACTIAESIEFEVPTLLVPFPGALDNHQEKNADFMVSIKGSKKILEKDLSPIDLAHHITHLPLDEMKNALSHYNSSRKVTDLSTLICDFIKDKL